MSEDTPPAPAPTPTPAPSPAPTPAPTPAPADPPGQLTLEALEELGLKSMDDVQKALRWKEHARTWETRAETTARELAEARKGGLTDDQKKIEDAKAEARAEVMGTVGLQLAEAAFTRIATGKVGSVEDALELLAPAEKDGSRPDLKRYLKEDGTVNGTAIEAAVERLAKLAPPGTGKPPVPTVERGPRGGGRPTQLTRADLQRLEREGKQEEIMKAQAEGQLEDLLSGKIK